MAVNKQVYVNLNNMTLDYPQKLILTNLNPAYPSLLNVEIGATDPQWGIQGYVEQAMFASIGQTLALPPLDYPIQSFRYLTNFTLKDKNGVQVLRMSHSDRRVDYNVETETETVQELLSLYVKNTIPVDFGTSGLTSTHDITAIVLRCHKDHDTSKLFVEQPDGYTSLYMAQDLFSQFTLESHVTPKNSTDYNTVAAYVSLGGSVSGSTTPIIKSYQVTGSGTLKMEYSGTITHL